MEEELRVLSRSLVQAPIDPDHPKNDVVSKIELTPWDLELLTIGGSQKGLLFHKPKSFNLENLKTSLSSTLNFFPPLSGRLSINQYSDNTSSVFIVLNNLGVLFIHAIAPNNITLSQILNSTYVPRIIHSFFPLNGVNNHQGTTHPLLAVQVTELLDGVFIGFNVNHSVIDGTSFWHFVNTWSAISRNDTQSLSNIPSSFQRWFPENIHRPIRFHFPNQNDNVVSQPLPPPERMFHFTKDNIASLKAKATAELKGVATTTTKLSSLQVVLCHVWRCMIKHRHLQPQQEVTCKLAIGARQRVSELAENYVGNALYLSTLRMKAVELVEKDGLGKSALEMNKMIALYTEEKIKELYEDWVRNPVITKYEGDENNVVVSSSPRFDIYSNDFGWGKPVAVRSGPANKPHGKITVYRGAEEEGSMDVEVCVDFEILEAIASDHEFMDFVTIF